MKKLLLLCLFLTPVYSMSSNEAIYYCLAEHGYEQSNFNNFGFTAAAGCAHKYIAANEQAESERTSRFLENNPHYRGDGSGWRKKTNHY